MMKKANYVLFKTQLFREPEDHELDKHMPGGDCAGWLHNRLLADAALEHVQEPVMEDWGWCPYGRIGAVVAQVGWPSARLRVLQRWFDRAFWPE